MLKAEFVDRAVAAIKGYAQYQYFFEHLDSPKWLEPLAERGFFKEPPPAEKVGEYIRLPFWPESRYLVRMAAIPEAQATVVRIARNIPATDNSRVYDDTIDMALALPAGYAAELLDQIAIGVRLPIKLVLEDRIGDLIRHLAEHGQAAAALSLTRIILALAPDPELNIRTRKLPCSGQNRSLSSEIGTTPVSLRSPNGLSCRRPDWTLLGYLQSFLTMPYVCPANHRRIRPMTRIISTSVART
jgi:hypothetical protein